MRMLEDLFFKVMGSNEGSLTHYVEDQSCIPQLLSWAKSWGIVNIFYHRLSEAFPDFENLAFYGLSHKNKQKQLLQFQNNYQILNQKLLEAGIRSVLIENASIACRGATCFGCNKFKDFDVIISRKYKEDIIKTLQPFGYIEIVKNALIKENRFTLKSNNVDLPDINFQYDLVATRFGLKKRFELDEFQDQDIFQKVNGITLFDIEYTLWQLVVHVYVHGFISMPRYWLYIDIVRHCRKGDINWTRFCGIVGNSGDRQKAYIVIKITELLFGIRVPSSFYLDLKANEFYCDLLIKWIVLSLRPQCKASTFKYVIFKLLTP